MTTLTTQKRILKATELGGIPFIVLMGSFLHFTYQMSGGNFAVAMVSAINESVWEHLKLAFFPTLILAAIQYPLLRNHYPNFFFGKAVGIFAMPTIIVAGFYTYKFIFHSSNLAYDIGLFITSIIVGQILSYKIIVKNGAKPFNFIPVAMLALYAMAFFVFTVSPPQFELFRDPVTGGYGLNAHGN